MYCGSCGAFNQVGTNNCSNCGNPLIYQTPVNPISQIPKKNNKILFIVIPVVVILLVLCIILFGSSKRYIGTWHCRGYNSMTDMSKDYMITMELKSNGKYVFGDYKDLANNHSAGSYTVTEKKAYQTKANGETTYLLLDFVSEEYIADGKQQPSRNKVTMQLEMDFINRKEALIINTRTNAMYYCNK